MAWITRRSCVEPHRGRERKTCARDEGDCLFFFFQAEDGIRDLTVTGVQTCALPISDRNRHVVYSMYGSTAHRPLRRCGASLVAAQKAVVYPRSLWPERHAPFSRSEEHTSELQSQSNLVCRLLLEKKNENELINDPSQ